MCQVPFSAMKNGTYLAEFRHGCSNRKITFRWERAHQDSGNLHMFSADFHENGQLLASIRGKLKGDLWPCGDLTVQKFHQPKEEGDQEMIINLHAVTEDTLEIQCRMTSEDEPWLCVLHYQGPYYRKLLVRMIRMPDIELPPPLKLHDFPLPVRPHVSQEEAFETSLEHLFSRMDIQLDVEIDNLEDTLLPFDMDAYRHCPERILWDEKALHQLMLDQLPEMDEQADWTANLLLLRGFHGTHGVYDFGSKDDFRRTVGLMFDRQSGFQLSNPGTEQFYNARPRQGAAIFWDPLVARSRKKNDWYLQLEFAFLMVHEIGHILNLRHAPDCMELTYMNYPDRFCGGRDEFWRQFGFVFTHRERAHLNHGFLPEVQPGGAVGFPLIQRPQQKASQPQGLGARLYLQMTKPVFAHREPVTVDIALSNESGFPMTVPPLDPSFGDLHIHILRPDKTLKIFHPPVVKCLVEKDVLDPGQASTHTALISIDMHGFWLDEPGHYIVQATTNPGHSGEPMLQASTEFIREEPQAEEPLSHKIFESPHAAHFLYFKGANLGNARQDWLDFLAESPEHPICGLAHQALALYEIPICHRRPGLSKNPHLTPTAIEHFQQAIEHGELPLSHRRALIEIYDPSIATDNRNRGFFAKLKSWRKRFMRLFKKPKLKDFLGTHHLQIQIGGKKSKGFYAKLTVEADPKESHLVTYELECPDRPRHSHRGKGQFDKGNRFQDPYLFLQGISLESANEFDVVLRFATSLFSSKLYLAGKITVGGGGGGTNTPVTGAGTEDPEPSPPGSDGS